MISLRHNEALDQDLLLLAHDALSLGPHLRVQAHLRRCPACRVRLTQLTQTSVLLAAGSRGPSLPAWSRADAVSRAAPPLPIWLIVPALTVLITMLCLTAWTSLAPAHRPAAHAVMSGCRSDLPNSRCR